MTSTGTVTTVTACTADPSGTVLTGLAMHGVTARATVTAITARATATAATAVSTVGPGVPAVVHGIGS